MQRWDKFEVLATYYGGVAYYGVIKPEEQSCFGKCGSGADMMSGRTFICIGICLLDEQVPYRESCKISKYL